MTKQTVIGVLTAGVVALVPQTTPADAQSSKLERCVDAAIESCDELFPGDGIFAMAARGWCYTIATAACVIAGAGLN